MNILKPIFLTTLNLLFTLFAKTQEYDLSWINKAGANPFVARNKIYKVNHYGAQNDGKTLCTKSIQTAINECAKNGGGKIYFEKGIYVTGAIFLKKNVHLYLDKNVKIIGSTNLDDYPEIDTRIAGIEMKWPAALINIIDQENVLISGDGTIDARGKFCWDKYWNMRKEYDPKGLRWVVDYDAKRVKTLLVQNAKNVTLESLTFLNAGFWTVQILYSSHITVNALSIQNNVDGHGPSTDGIDIDSSTWILVENCDIDCNDDNIVLKAGRDADGLRVNKPTEYVVIKNCRALRGMGIFTLGSETSGGIKNIYAKNLIAKGTDNGFYIKSAITRGGIVENIFVDNIQMDSIDKAFNFNLNWYPAYSYSTLPEGYNYENIPSHWKKLLTKVEPAEKGIPTFRNIFISNVLINKAKQVFYVEGLEKSPFKNFIFSNIKVSADKQGVIKYIDSWKFNDVSINSVDDTPLKTEYATKSIF